MSLKKSITVLLILLPSLSSSAEFRDVPKKLFSIELGRTYVIGDPEGKDIGSIPVKKFAGIKQFMGNGIHYYFYPKDEDNTLEYLEKNNKVKNLKFGTPYRLYLLPVIPSTITTLVQLEKMKLKWEVQSIGWSQNAKTKEEAYNWAVDLCKTLKLNISVVPEIKDFVDSKWFECTFSSGDREYKVSNINVIRSVELSYKKEIIEAKEEAVEKKCKKLQSEKSQPNAFQP